MCISPIYIKNPLRNPRFDRGETCFVSDTESLMIPVPCGVCHECLLVRQNAVIQRVHAHSLEHYMFMFTLTYNPEMIPRIVLGSDTLFAFNYSHFNKMLQAIRRKKLIPYPFSHLVVGEYGTKRHRPHYHGLLCFSKRFFSPDPAKSIVQLHNLETLLYDVLRTNWATNIGSRRYPEYIPLFTYAKRGHFSNFDLHFVDTFKNPTSGDSVAHYVTKYLVKEDNYLARLKGYLFTNFPKDVAFHAWKKLRPRVTMSRHFGVNRTSAHLIDEFYTETYDTGKLQYRIGTNVMPLCSYFTDKLIPKKLRPHESISDKSVVLDTTRSTASRISSYTKKRLSDKKRNLNNLDFFLEL